MEIVMLIHFLAQVGYCQLLSRRGLSQVDLGRPRVLQNVFDILAWCLNEQASCNCESKDLGSVVFRIKQLLILNFPAYVDFFLYRGRRPFEMALG